MKKLVALCIGLFCLHKVHAQNLVNLPPMGVKVSYMGSLLYPGFKIGIEQSYKIRQLNKKKSWGTKTIFKERYWTLNLGYYHHTTFHDNLYLLAEWQLRRQKSNGLFFEFAPGLGYSRTFLNGTTYQVDDDGGVSKVSAAGYNYVMLSIAGGIGYDFSKKTDLDIKAFLKPSILVMAPYNSFLYVRPTVELGIIFSPSNF
jgi:hypothetical protein